MLGKRRTGLRFILLITVAYFLPAQSSIQLWYQPAGANLGPVMQVVTDGEGRIFASVHQKGIYRSLDSAKSWQAVAPYTDGVWSMAVRPNNEIVASLWSRGVYRSTDHGATWTAFADPRLNADIRGVNANGDVFIECAGMLYRSSANDTAWIAQPVTGAVMAFSGSTIVTMKGTNCYRSTNNGDAWSVVTSVPASAYAAAIDPDGSIYAGTVYDGTQPAPSLYAIYSGDHSWRGTGPASTINAILRRSAGVLFAASHDSGFYYSTSAGTQWKQYNTGLSTTKIYSLALLNDTTVIAGTLDGVFLSRGPLASLLPVELVSFTATVTEHSVLLRWRTATEVNNHGFSIDRRMLTENNAGPWQPVGSVEGSGTSNMPHEYLFADRHPDNGSLEYRLKQTDRDGAVSYLSTLQVTVHLQPVTFSLEQNFPNPFNPATVIRYTLPAAAHVTLTVSDLLGRSVAVPVDTWNDAGDHEVRFDASPLSAGCYLYTLRSGSTAVTRSMLLLR